MFNDSNNGGTLDNYDTPQSKKTELTDGRLGLAPVNKPRRVLDVATGTGIWAQQYASNNPSCQVVGADISAMERPHSLPNLTFHQVDVETEEFPGGPDEKYDYIFLRYIVSCFDSTQTVFRRAFEHLAPGGWIEIYDTCQSIYHVGRPHSATALDRWMSMVVKSSSAIGRNFHRPRYYAEWLQEAGFVNVTEMKFVLPIQKNLYAADERLVKISELMSKNEMRVMKSLGKILRMTLTDEDEARALEDAAKKVVQDPKHMIMKETYNIYAQKPQDA
ncbi:hypothetical protein E4U21_000240 [Claviceps maximensis]|nr:hypothetical protein E4U21_000240 [Claviceps maximensis]